MPFTKNDPNINREGRPPKDWTWASVVREAMEAIENPEDRLEVKYKIAQALMNKAKEGDVQAIKEIGDRIDGKANQFIDHTSKGEKIVMPIMGGTADVLKNNLIPEAPEAK